MVCLNKDKCKLLRIGQAGKSVINNISNMSLIESSCERYLGILVSNDIKWNEQTVAASSKANQMLGLIRRSFKSRGLRTIRRLYCGLVRPILDYAAQVWSPYFIGNIRLLKKVQRKATRLPWACKDLQYPSLKHRRIRGDLIQLYKCVNGLEHINWEVSLRWKPTLIAEGPAGNV
jgi:ribonucleases P/MRP protein subunit RPP40